MKVLVTIQQSPHQTFLVRLLTKSLIKEVRNLIENEKHMDAVHAVFSKGTFERIVSEKDAHKVGADLILSKNGARWDLVK